MKKGFLKRIIAIALAFFMAVSGMQFSGSVSKAEGSYSGILTMNRAEGSASASNIYFMGTDTMPITGADGSGDAWTYNVLQAADAESGVFLNGEPMNARLLKYCTVPCRYYMSFDAVQNGDVITIKGTFTISNGNSITFREMTYTYNAETGKWVESMPVDESAVMSLEVGNGMNGFYAVASDSMPVVSWTESIFPILDGKSGVWVNDVWKNVPIKRHSEDKYYVGLVDGVDGGACTAQAGDVIRFGGKYTYGGYIVEFAEIAFEFDGTNWIELKPVADIALTLHDAEVKNGGSKNVAFYAASFDELEPLGWEGAAYKAMNEESGIFVNGTRHQGSIKNYANGRYYVEGFSAVEAGQTVTVKGKFRSNGGTKDINVPEVSFLFNGSYWEEIITSADATGTFTQIDYDYNTAKNVSLFADYTHPVTSWDKNFLAASGENGLFLNGNKVDIPMKQYAAGKYFIALSDVGVVPVKGDVLEVKGCFTMGGSSVLFAPITLTFNGAAWSTDMPVVPYTDVTVTGAEGVNAGADGNGAYWDFNLRTDAEIPGENWGTQYFDAVVEYKGNPIARTFVKRAGATVLNVFFYDSIVPDKQVGDTLVLKAGEYQAYSVSTYRPSGYGMKLTKDFVFTWDGTTWVETVIEEESNLYDVSAYRSGETFTAPTKAGYVFAGWYEDEACTVPMDADVTEGDYYAKFIDADVLSVKAQVTKGTTASSEETNMRFISTVDGLDYQAVGFKIKVGDRAEKTTTSTVVYKQLYANVEGEIDTILPTDLCEESAWFFTYGYWKIPNYAFDMEFVVTPYFVTADGTTVWGETVVKMVSQSYS